MKIKFSNKINYYTEALSVVYSYVKNEDYYEIAKERHKQKYNIPIEELDSLYDEISNIHNYIISKIDIPKERLEYYFSSDDEKT